MTANSPFTIDDGPHGNASYLVVSRPLLAGVYDLVITAYAALSRASTRFSNAWYQVRVEGQLATVVSSCEILNCTAYPSTSYIS